LDAIGIGLAIIGGIDDIKIRLCGNYHKALSLAGMVRERNGSWLLELGLKVRGSDVVVII
jgi:hypothetical protein